MLDSSCGLQLQSNHFCDGVAAKRYLEHEGEKLGRLLKIGTPLQLCTQKSRNDGGLTAAQNSWHSFISGQS